MASSSKFKKSTVAALLALCFFGALFAVGMSDPAIYYAVVIGGIVVSSVMAIYYWKAERRNDAKTSAIGLWIVGAILIAFLLLCLLPALS